MEASCPSLLSSSQCQFDPHIQSQSDMVPHPSMMTEIEELLSSIILDTSGQLSIGISPKRPTSMAPDVLMASGGKSPLSHERLIWLP